MLPPIAELRRTRPSAPGPVAPFADCFHSPSLEGYRAFSEDIPHTGD